MTRAERKAYNQGKRDGYDIGYIQGLYDGNPFNKFIDAVKKAVDGLKDCDIEAISEQLNEGGNEDEPQR